MNVNKMEDNLDLLKDVWYYYNTHSREEIDELWKEIEKEDHVGPTCTEYENFLNDK